MSARDFPDCPPVAGGRLIDARLHVLDRQVLDVAGDPVGVVDDLELDDVEARVIEPGTPPLAVRNLVHGPIVLSRIFGRRRPRGPVSRVRWDQLDRIGAAIRLAVPAAALEVGWLERWLADNVVGRIPGGRHVPR